jgi:uncharacterized protein YjbJ (UPF0337 family)
MTEPQIRGEITGKYKVNKDQLQGSWKVVAGKVKEKWGEITDDELDQIDGRAEQ